MKHPSELELLECLAGRADPDRAQAVGRHLDACEPCRRVSAELARAWAALGRWDLAPPTADPWPAIRDRLTREVRSRRARPRWGTLLRWAAAIALAALVGQLAGRAARQGWRQPAAPIADAPVVAAYLYLDAVAANQPPGLSRSLEVFLESPENKEATP